MPPSRNLLSARFATLGEILGFLKQRKKLWLMPLVLAMILIGGLILFSQASALSPLIYTLF